MDEINEFLEEIGDSLQEKWLAYYTANRLWLVASGMYKEQSFVQEMNGVRQNASRPSSSFILGVVSILEPRLSQILPYWFKFNSNKEELINKLGLNFDLDSVLAHRELESLKMQQTQAVLLPEAEENTDIEDNRTPCN
ncbi:DUF5331 domain-containing protein [Lusitaniella coriacea]|uniref:DUF5331 domain-containing protein n=1 Tax=Lusitaniella coriacea TaxID=1983105 RepID=UPI003CF1551D